MTAVELTSQQLAELGADLRRLREEVGGQLQRIDASTAPVTLDQQAVGRLSRMDAMQQQAMAKASESHMRVHLKRVLLALAAIEQGEYGFCRDCDEAIGYARLKARPDTPLCLRCQAAQEAG